jgi:transposase
MDRLSRRLRRENPDWEVIKGIKWVLFKQPQNLNSEQEQLLKKAFDECESLSLMHQQRNECHKIFDANSSYLPSLVPLNTGIEKVEKSQVEPYWNKSLHTLDNYKGYILNFVKNRLTNAATEGRNNLIRHIKRISFGIPDFDNMRCSILALNP